MTNTFESLADDVRTWCVARGIADPALPGSAVAQSHKMGEEVLELQDELDDNNCLKAAMELGDVLVTAIATAKALGVDPVKCLEKAVDKIRDRTGKVVNGQFVKEEDL